MRKKIAKRRRMDPLGGNREYRPKGASSEPTRRTRRGAEGSVSRVFGGEKNWRERILPDSVPGIGGRLRARPEDFRVEEIPLASPSGDGEHLHLWVEKRGISTIEVLRTLCRALDIPESGGGVCGS